MERLNEETSCQQHDLYTESNGAISDSGYCLKRLETYISEKQSKWSDCPIRYYDSIDSTNNEAKRLGREGTLQDTLIIAEEQTAGKGRLGRMWDAPKGDSICMTLLLHPKLAPENASMLTLLAALAVTDAVKTVTNISAQIKWPNDIVINGRKLCGILTEMSADLNEIRYVVVGIGINCNIASFPTELTTTATSLFLETGKKQSREKLIAEIMWALGQYYEVFLQTQDLVNLKTTYEKQLVNYNRKVRVLSLGTEPNEKELIGISRGINEKGELLVEDENKYMHVVRTGEVSVRGIYGYTI